MPKTKNKNNINYYAINGGEHIFEVSVVSDKAGTGFAGRIDIWFSNVIVHPGGDLETDLHGYCLKDAEDKTFRSLARNEDYPMRARTIDGAITAYLDQFDSYKKIPAKDVKKRLAAFAAAKGQHYPVSAKISARAQTASR